MPGNEAVPVHMEGSLHLFTSMKPFSLRIGALRLWHVQSEGRECKGGQLLAATLSPFIFCSPQDAYPLQHKSRLAGYKLGCQFFLNRLACRASFPDVLSTGKLGENINWYWMGGGGEKVASFLPPSPSAGQNVTQFAKVVSSVVYFLALTFARERNFLEMSHFIRPFCWYNKKRMKIS